MDAFGLLDVASGYHDSADDVCVLLHTLADIEGFAGWTEVSSFGRALGLSPLRSAVQRDGLHLGR